MNPLLHYGPIIQHIASFLSLNTVVPLRSISDIREHATMRSVCKQWHQSVKSVPWPKKLKLTVRMGYQNTNVVLSCINEPLQSTYFRGLPLEIYPLVDELKTTLLLNIYSDTGRHAYAELVPFLLLKCINATLKWIYNTMPSTGWNILKGHPETTDYLRIINSGSFVWRYGQFLSVESSGECFQLHNGVPPDKYDDVHSMILNVLCSNDFRSLFEYNNSI